MAIAKKKKRFFEVEMPLIGKSTHLLAYKPEELQGRVIKYDITRMLKGKNVLLDLDVHANEDKVTSTPKKLAILPSFIRRMIRKRTDTVEDSFETKSKDANLIVKPFLITRRKVSRAVKKQLRETTKQELEKYLKNKSYEQVFDDIIKNKLQKDLSIRLKKVYPLSLCEIRVLKVKEKFENKEETEKQEENKKKESSEKTEEKTKEEQETSSKE